MSEITLDEGALAAWMPAFITSLGEINIVLLRGTLASGKTTFVRKFVKALGSDEPVSSPTFSILHTYASERVYHYDLYQCGLKGFLERGLAEMLETKAYHLIEWGEDDFECLLKEFGIPYVLVEMTVHAKKRHYKVSHHAYA